MAHRATAPLQETTLDGKTRVGEIEEGIHRLHVMGVEQLGIDAIDPHGVATPREGITLGIGVAEIEHAALRHHGVEVEVLLEALPQLHRPFVERVVAGEQIVGADDCRVAADVAGAEPALLQHRHIGEAMLLGEVVSRGKPMAAAADDDHIVLLLGLWLAPGRRPVLVAGESVLEE